MNVKSQDPRDLVIGLLNRSTCSVQVAAVLVDSWGCYAWGWNSVGSGFGLHAEAHCISRGNRKRFPESTMYVAAKRQRNGKVVTAKPCLLCQPLLQSIGRVVYRDSDRVWKSV